MTTTPSVLAKPALSEDQCKELFRRRDEAWYDITVGGANIGDDQMRAYLDYWRSHEDGKDTYKVAFPADKPSPILPIYTVLIGVLPKDLRELIRKIQGSWTVIDTSSDPDNITGTAHGAMRAWHQNDTKMLPRLTGPSVQHSIVSDKYQSYIEEHKQLPTKQVKKGEKQEYTGYVEYTLRSWRSAQGRMVYDYYNNRFFLTPGHYAAGDFSRNAFFFVQLD